MTSPHSMFCSWGMYAFTEPLQAAWQNLFDTFRSELTNDCALDPVLRFDTDEATLRNPSLLVGQTCGYPLIKFYKHDLVPVCVPVFEVDGCDDIFYSSAVIVSADSDTQTLQDCAGKTVAINGPDSNSGMNLLRDAIAGFSPNAPYFSSTLVSGSHCESIRAVSEKRADVAAIDCVTFSLTRSAFPELVNSVRVLTYTNKSAGLPFVISTAHAKSIAAEQLTEWMNNAFDTMSSEHRAALPVNTFKTVSVADYRSIEEMESAAQQSGHSPLAL